MDLTLRDITLNDDEEINGSSGRVIFGVHESTNTQVAVKYLARNTENDRLRFEQENSILYNLEELDNVITPYSRILGSDDSGKHYLMEKADDNLDGYLDTVVSDEDFVKKLDLFIDICRAVLSIQSLGYIHRDLHFKNIMINYIDGRVVPMLVDFGRSYNIHGPLEISDGENPTWGALLRPPEVEFGLVDHDDQSHILGDSYAIGYLIKSCMQFEVISNAGHLIDMKNSIKKFIKKRHNMSVKRYLATVDFEHRKADYLEWCELNQSRSEEWLTINLDDQDKTNTLSNLSRSLSNLNYEARNGDLELAITALERLY